MLRNTLIFNLFLAISLSAAAGAQAQTIQARTQTIRGVVLDKEAQFPLAGATIAVMNTDPALGTATDEEGRFKLENVPVGRHDLEINFLGYEPYRIGSLMVTSGKEVVLTLELVESAIEIQAITVTAAAEKSGPLNEMAVVSARSFSVEETSRYAGSYYDPARMAQNFAGVSMGESDDLSNEIVVRGNSPSGLLWRLEGIDIPNPNHFGAMGNSGGAISMLSSSILSNSDFFTGAFPAEYGNALSGVFDLNMRNGNNEKREFSFMLGLLGIEASAEGPFSKKSRASYLVNYRYSTLAAMQQLGLNPAGDILPSYQDLAFKIHLPTAKAGTFALFGLGGANRSYFDPEPDASLWETDDDRWGFDERQQVGTIGGSHRILLNDKSYLRTVFAASSNRGQTESYWLDEEKNYQEHPNSKDDSRHDTYRASITYNLKMDARNSLRAGVIATQQHFEFATSGENDDDLWTQFFDNTGNMASIQAFAQWKNRLSPALAIHGGLHYTRLLLNSRQAIDPRASLQWQISPAQTISLAAGLHSKIEHPATYLFDGVLADGALRPATKNLKLTKAFHAVLGYDRRLNEQLRLKAEWYYQHLFDVPVENQPGSTRSILNASNIWEILGITGANNQGTGRNYGMDLTLEKFFSNQTYFLITGSLYDSRFKTATGDWYHTRFNGQYQFNALAGREFNTGRKKQNRFGVNGRFTLSGGSRMTPIDLQASREQEQTVRYEDRPYTERLGTYSRIDASVSYRINAAKIAHAISLDVQNVFNRTNVFSKYYSDFSGNIETYFQTGILPVFNYRLEF